jgi:hypothetical protein
VRNEELYNAYTSPNVIRAIKSGRIGWTGRIARIGKIKNSLRFVVGQSEGKNKVKRDLKK